MADMRITERTLIPISLVISLISAVIYATMVFAKVDAQEKEISKHEQKLDSVTTLLVDIRDRIIRLEEGSKKQKE